MRHDPGRRRSGGWAERSVVEPGRACQVSSASVSSLGSPQPTPSRAPRALLSLAHPGRAPAGSGPSRLRSPGPGLPCPHGPAALLAQLLAPLSREPRSPGQLSSRTRQPPQPCPGPSPGTAQTRSNLRGWQRGACIVLEASERPRSGAHPGRAPVCVSHPSAFRPHRAPFGVFAASAPEGVCVCVCLSPVSLGQGFS